MARFVLASLFAQSVQAFNVGFAPPLARSLRASSVRMADDEFSYTPKTVFMFPGQGAQTVGMGVEVAAEVPAAAELYAKASEILGYDLLAKCKDGPKEELDSTVISQPAIFVASMAAVEKLKATEEGAATIAAADVACGLSLGEYTALAFAGAISFEDGVKITKARGEAMQAASEAASSGMVSVIGLKSDKVRLPRPEPVVPLTRGRAGVRARVRGKGLRCALGEGRALAPLSSDRTAPPPRPPAPTTPAPLQVEELCKAAAEATGESVQIANFLCDGNYACSGSKAAVAKVAEIAKPEFKARMAVPLSVAGAFHTEFMAPAVPALEAVLKEARHAPHAPHAPATSHLPPPCLLAACALWPRAPALTSRASPAHRPAWLGWRR